MVLSPTLQEPENKPLPSPSERWGSAQGSRQRVLESPLLVKRGPAQDPVCPGGAELAHGWQPHQASAGVCELPRLLLPVGAGAHRAVGLAWPQSAVSEPLAVYGRGGCSERFGAPGLRGGAGACRESSPWWRCVPEAAPYLRPHPARGRTSLPPTAGCGSAPLEKPQQGSGIGKRLRELS